jgi:hypothetical protein
VVDTPCGLDPLIVAHTLKHHLPLWCMYNPVQNPANPVLVHETLLSGLREVCCRSRVSVSLFERARATAGIRVK